MRLHRPEQAGRAGRQSATQGYRVRAPITRGPATEAAGPGLRSLPARWNQSRKGYSSATHFANFLPASRVSAARVISAI